MTHEEKLIYLGKKGWEISSCFSFFGWEIFKKYFKRRPEDPFFKSREYSLNEAYKIQDYIDHDKMLTRLIKQKFGE